MSFSKLYFSSFIKPAKTFKSLLADTKSLQKSFYAVLICAVLYTFVYVFLILGGGQPYKPWLNIPLQSYYKWNVFFCAPSMFLGWILAAGVIHSISRIFTSAGSFDKILVLLGFSISIASWSTGLHDIITSFLGGVHIINQHDYEIALNSPTIWRTLLWIQMIAYLIWFSILFTKAAKTVYGFKLFPSFLLGFFGFAIYQFFFFIFNR